MLIKELEDNNEEIVSEDTTDDFANNMAAAIAEARDENILAYPTDEDTVAAPTPKSIEAANRKLNIAREFASNALQENLQLTIQEAQAIVEDPAYKIRDMLLIPSISQLLNDDLFFTIEAFYVEDITPNYPNCTEIFKRMVERFPAEPLIRYPSSDDPHVFDNAINISKGLVRRLLRGRQYQQTCEQKRIDAQTWYNDTKIYDDAHDVAQLKFTHVGIYSSDAAKALGSAPLNNYFVFLNDKHLQGVTTAFILMTAFGACALYSLYRPANCVKNGIVATLGLFKRCSSSRAKTVDDETPSFFPAP